MIEPAAPTFLCRSWAAYRLLQEGQVEAAEDELAAAFGFRNERIKREGRLIAKMIVPNGLTPEQELAFYSKAQDVLKQVAIEKGFKVPE